MRPPLQADTATRHRAAAVFALAFACAAVTSFGGALAFNFGALRVVPAFQLDILPDSTWPARWLPGAITAADQQRAAAEQWLHVILVFGALTAAIACINALIGLLSHANERRYETAVRGIVGATPRQLRAALRRTALANAALGVLAGVPAGALAAHFIRQTWDAPVAMMTTQSWALLAAGVSLVIAMLAARMAASKIARQGWLGDALAPEARSLAGWGAEDLRALLTGAQLACAVALTTVSLLVWSYADTQSAAALRHTQQSSASGTVSVARVSLPQGLSAEERRRAFAGILAAVEQTDGVDTESIASPGALLGIGKIDKVVADCGRCASAGMMTPLFPVETQQHIVSPGFFDTAGVALNQGRDFERAATDARAVVVNQRFASIAFQGQRPIGKRILVGGFGGEWYHVIGVVADVPTVGLHFVEADPLTPGVSAGGNAPAVYFSTAAAAPAVFDVIARTRGARVALAGLRFEPLARVFERANAPQKSFARVVTLLGLLLCGAAAIGTFTATLLNVKARRHEIAVRRALGASRQSIWLLMYGALMRTVLRGVLAGLVGSLALARALELFVPGLPVFNVGSALLVAGSFALIACAAAVPPVREALRVSPAHVHD